MQTTNPAFKNDAFAPKEWGGIMKDLETSKRLEGVPGAMSLGGTMIKTAFSLMLCIASALAAAHLVKAGSIGNPNLLGGTTCGVSRMDCNPMTCRTNQTCSASGFCQ